MRFEVSAETDAPLEEVWRWWIDYGHVGDEHRVHHGLGMPGKRRVLEAEGSRVVLAESLPLPFVGGLELSRREVRIDHDEHRLHERTLEGAPFEAIWRFESTAVNGTRVHREVVAEHGPGKFAPAAVARPLVQRDLEHHVREFEKERRG